MSIYLESQQIEQFKKENLENYFPTHFKFLESHHGPRPGKLHGLIGTSGSGKSTLARALILAFAKHGSIFVWLSEEEVTDYGGMLNGLCRDKPILKNIHLYSELDLSNSYKKDLDTFYDQFEERACVYKPKLILIDNITTSIMYDESIGPAGQRHSADRLRSFAVRSKIPIFYITHTKKDVSDNDSSLIDLGDIRGSAYIANTSGYVYIFQRFQIQESFYPFINVRKHRGHHESGGYYLLEYSKGAYTRDYPLTFDEVNAAFKARNRLGKE